MANFNRRSDSTYNDYMDIARKYETRAMKKSKSKSFGSQKINWSDLPLAPENYEIFFYTAYFIFIPYLAGNLFLLIFVTGGSFSSFQTLDKSSFFILWAIGYEIVASITLILIFISFLKYKDDE